MGYSTNFFSSFKLDKPLDPLHKEYLVMFSETRRMKRNAAKLHTMFAKGLGNKRCFDLCIALNLPVQGEGEFYCGTGSCGQDGGYGNNGVDDSVTEYNYPPNSQPGLWCGWIPSEDGTEIEWDGGEKFYSYVEWLEYLIANFLAPWGYKLNGIVEWQGEDRDDTGVIQIVDNEVTEHNGKRRSDFKVEATPKPIVPSVAPTTTSEVILDLIKLRNELQSSKKGTAVACKKLDELIKKYGV
jgi:hypothetical protein